MTHWTARKRLIEALTRAKVCEALFISMMISSLLGLGGRPYAMLAVDRLPLGKKMLAVEAKLALIIFCLHLFICTDKLSELAKENSKKTV